MNDHHMSTSPGRLPEASTARSQGGGDLNSLEVPELVLPKNLTYLHKDQVALISAAKLVIFDLDETIIHGTGEAVHDGSNGRFSYAARQVLRTYRGLEGDWEHVDHWKEIWNGDPMGTGLRRHAGKSEAEVIAGIAADLKKQFDIPAEVDQIAREMEPFARKFFQRDPHKIKSVKDSIFLAEGMVELMHSLKDLGIPMAVCTSSGAEFVKYLNTFPEYKELLDSFVVVRTGARKKVADGSFVSAAVEDIINQVKVSRKDVVMIGDSFSDAGALALAGGAVAVLCPPGTEAQKKKSLRKYGEEYFLAEKNHGALVTDAQYIIVGSLNQVIFTSAFPTETPLAVRVGTRNEIAPH